MSSRDEYYNDQEEGNRLMLDGRQAELWTAMPGVVTSVNFATMTLEVQPAIQGLIETTTGPEYVNLPKLINVPINFPMAGGFALTLPIAVNDEVLIVFASRCIDAWWQSGGIPPAPPPELRFHDLSDGFAIVGIKSVPNVIPGISATTAQLRNTAGTTYVELDASGKINLVSPSGIDLTGPVNITGNTVITGSLLVTEEVTGGVIPIPLSTHIHPGVTSGSSDTGAPIP